MSAGFKKKLIDFIKIGESETIEFKESFNDEAIETVGAFANANGGTLLIGLKDNGCVCGYSIGKKTLEDISNRIQETTDPRLQPSIFSLVYQKKSLIIIQVAVGTGIPISVKGRYFRRVSKTNQRMSHEEIIHRMMISTGLSWDMVTETGSTIADLDANRIHLFIQSVKKLGRKPIPEQASDIDFLKKIELIRNNIPTRAALLLFGKNPAYYFSSAFLKAGRFRSPILIVDDREIHGTLIEQLDGIMGWFRERLETEFIIKGKPERDVKWEYPLSAIREAMVNVLCHRDYTSSAHSQIRLYDDHLEIWNPGSLPTALTTEALLLEHDSIPRNRKIAEAFFYAGLIERWGSGTLRIVDDLISAGLPLPQFNSKEGRFRLTFYRKIFNFKEFQKLNLSKRQLKAIAYIKEHDSINNTQYQLINHTSKRTATRDLSELKEKELLYPTGKGRNISYKLKEP